jgi:hypothetical protein
MKESFLMPSAVLTLGRGYLKIAGPFHVHAGCWPTIPRKIESISIFICLSGCIAMLQFSNQSGKKSGASYAGNWWIWPHLARNGRRSNQGRTK